MTPTSAGTRPRRRSPARRRAAAATSTTGSTGRGGHRPGASGFPGFFPVFSTFWYSLTTVFVRIAIVSLPGRVEVRVRQNEGTVRTGLGPFKLRKRSDAGRLKRSGVGKSSWTQNDERGPLVEIEEEGDRETRFGSTLQDARLACLTASLRDAPVEPDHGRDAGLRFQR